MTIIRLNNNDNDNDYNKHNEKNKKKMKKKSVQPPATVLFNHHMHEIFLQLYCMKRIPWDPQKEMLN